jgi:glycosyltransferase involved in cell wall biosynthesis
VTGAGAQAGRAPTASVAIRGYRAHFLREAIASILGQTFADLEVVVYDDKGGLDLVVDEFADPRVRYQRATPGQDNSTKVRAALSLCRGAFLGTLDDDDRYEPTFLERVLEEFDRDSRVGVVFTDHYWEVQGRSFRRRCHFPGGTHEQMLAPLLSSWPVALSAAMLRREAWEQGEREAPIPGGVWADRFMWLRTASAGWAFTYVDQPLVTYRVHGAQMSASHDLMREPGVATLDAFRFDDPEAERLRRDYLTDALVSRAAHDLSKGRADRARDDLLRARELAPRRQRARGFLLRRLAAHPSRAPRVASLWRRRPRPPLLWRDRAAAALRLNRRRSA